jgi:hypothetical protein
VRAQGFTRAGNKWTFAIRSNTKLVTDRKMFEGYFGWAPVYLHKSCWRIAVRRKHTTNSVNNYCLCQVLPLQGADVPLMTVNSTYNLRLRLVKYIAHGGAAHVKLEVIRATAKP